MRRKDEVVLGFLDQWRLGDLGGAIGLLHEDAVYHNMPMAPIRGRDRIKRALEPMFEKWTFDFRTTASAISGSLVFTERVDVVWSAGREIARLPVAGVFEVDNDLIVNWRDYYDQRSLDRALVETS